MEVKPNQAKKNCGTGSALQALGFSAFSVYMYIFLSTYIYVYSHTYMYIYIHQYVYIYRQDVCGVVKELTRSAAAPTTVITPRIPQSCDRVRFHSFTHCYPAGFRLEPRVLRVALPDRETQPCRPPNNRYFSAHEFHPNRWRRG